MNLYNEIEPFAADWLENLGRAGHIAGGRVDRRSIRDIRAADLAGAAQCHFFAGIGVWSYALRLAGWPDDRPVWTGSCPCQPFSAAGKRGGFDDARHLWPEWFRLIRECRPPVIFGEQVASPDGLKWFDAVSADLEGAGYAVGAADLCAAGVGAPHIRQRLYFVAVAHHHHQGLEGRDERGDGADERPAGPSGVVRGLADDDDGRGGPGLHVRERRPGASVPDAPGCSDPIGLGDSSSGRGGRDTGTVPREEAQGDSGRFNARRVPHELIPTGATRGAWADADWYLCRDNKIRPTEPGSFPLAHGATGRVGRLRAYGNAIVAEVAATFIRASLSA